MSAELLALAVRAADAYARVKGPWLQRTGFEASPDPISPDLLVRAFLPGGRRESGLVIFNPFPRKEIAPMETIAETETTSPPPPLPAFRPAQVSVSLAVFDNNVKIDVETVPAHDYHGALVPPRAVVEVGDVRLVIWSPEAAFALAEAAREAVEFFDRSAVEASA